MSARADQAGARAARTERVAVDVAVGVLIRADGRFLLTSRPVGKVYAGYWEFPGGKFEPGESVSQALARELHEEIGIDIGTVELWKIKEFDYPHAKVRLHFCKVLRWTGALHMKEDQLMAWEQLPVTVTPVLPGTLPVLEWLALEQARNLTQDSAAGLLGSATDVPPAAAEAVAAKLS